MKFNNNSNYCILSNNINHVLLKQLGDIPIIDNTYDYNNLKAKLEFFPSKQVVFVETWYNLSNRELLDILSLLEKQGISYINVTSNIEYTLYADFIYVMDKENIVLEGNMSEVLKKEHTLKQLGYGLPFVVDLSLQLNYYGILDKVYYDFIALMEDLWN